MEAIKAIAMTAMIIAPSAHASEWAYCEEQTGLAYADLNYRIENPVFDWVICQLERYDNFSTLAARTTRIMTCSNLNAFVCFYEPSTITRPYTADTGVPSLAWYSAGHDKSGLYRCQCP